MKAERVKFETREQYLLAAVEAIRPIFTRAEATIPAVHVSTGWPSTRGTSQKRKALGECWDKSASADSVAQVFISPFLSDCLNALPPAEDGCGVLPTLVHELVHVSVGNDAGHGKHFRKLALAVGLEGKMTSTNAGKPLVAALKEIMADLGDYPHAKLDALLSGKKKQGTRMVKCECVTCGYVLRTTKKWLDIGVPSCPAGHGIMGFELPESSGDESDE
jgi:hypothetical protein